MGRLLQKLGQLVVDEIRCGDDCGTPPVAFLHQLEKNVGLLWFQIQISNFVNQEHVQPRQTLQQLSRRAVGQRCIHFIEQVLRLDELTPVAVFQRLQQQATS